MNTGHGYINPRDDGTKVNCGGPASCRECQREAAAKFFGSISTQVSTSRRTVVKMPLQELLALGMGGHHRLGASYSALVDYHSTGSRNCTLYPDDGAEVTITQQWEDVL